jgi:hypothetical protein
MKPPFAGVTAKTAVSEPRRLAYRVPLAFIAPSVRVLCGFHEMFALQVKVT